MTQITLRKWHRRVGAAIALFVILQAGSGFLIVWARSGLGDLALPYVRTLHRGYFPLALRPLWEAYRLLLAAGLIWMALSGASIAWLVKRARKARRGGSTGIPTG